MNNIISNILKINKKLICVGITGINASGKTTFSQKIKADLEKLGKNVFILSFDDYKAPSRNIEHLGEDMAFHYYHHWFDYNMIKKGFFERIKNEKVKIRSHNWEKEIDFSTVDVIILEGVFVFHPELIDYMDFKIFLDVNEETARSRILERDITFETKDIIRHKWEFRNIPAFGIYIKETNPIGSADIVLYEEDIKHIIKIR